MMFIYEYMLHFLFHREYNVFNNMPFTTTGKGKKKRSKQSKTMTSGLLALPEISSTFQQAEAGFRQLFINLSGDQPDVALDIIENQIDVALNELWDRLEQGESLLEEEVESN
jgi:hypothetical protein